jgi:predicted flap endonuclease-1-like 5' DNA nuclease
VTVEREPDPSTESEAAVKGTETADTTATAVEKPAGGVPDETAERADASTRDDSEAVEETDVESASRSDAEDSTTPVDEVKGIGPAYAERLTSTGVETVGDLVTADPDDVGDETDISPKRIARWQDRARDAEE